MQIHLKHKCNCYKLYDTLQMSAETAAMVNFCSYLRKDLFCHLDCFSIVGVIKQFRSFQVELKQPNVNSGGNNSFSIFSQKIGLARLSNMDLQDCSLFGEAFLQLCICCTLATLPTITRARNVNFDLQMCQHLPAVTPVGQSVMFLDFLANPVSVSNVSQ